ncbi:uncharacterized protein isoform X1 [Leptinotarsa decemlineata]|uniref:uncharacterized protein isoform X1 n=1 Tax=Leptinotarsa decemlineata TaxID=7539 RepID=UPI003D30CA0E
MDENPNFEEMKKIVEDAGMYEENMSKEDIQSIGNLLTKSKEEVEFKKMNENQEIDVEEDTNLEQLKVFEPKTSGCSKPSIESEQIDEYDSDDLYSESLDSVKDATKHSFGFNDMLKSTEISLQCIPHELKFVPIQSSQRFLNADCLLKAKTLYSYHTKIDLSRVILAKKSFYPAPLKDPISTNQSLTNTSGNKGDKEDTYISRSGRQTKRKVYYDQDEDSLDGVTSIKKTKGSEDQERPSKIKTPTRKTEKRTEDKYKEDYQNINVNEQEPELTPKTSENTKSSAKLKRLSNVEIMKRSSLFADSSPRLNRTEAIFDKLVEEKNKKDIEEKVMESFQRSLNAISKESEKTDEVINVDEEEPSRRVVPPAPILKGRKPINSRKKKPSNVEPLNIKKTNKNSSPVKSPVASSSQASSESSETFSIPKTIVSTRRISQVQTTESVSPRSRSRDLPVPNSVSCPICGDNFHKNKIVEHASTCGDDQIEHTSPQKQSRISCEICDAVIPLSTEYEVHVKECLNRRKEKDLADH